MTLHRRNLLGLMGASAAFGGFGMAHAATGRDPRFVTIILRGALDGLSAVPPVGDPDFERVRGELASIKTDALPLTDLFAINPAMPQFARLYKAGQGAVVHAVASSYRERSHFDGQDILESGQEKTGFTRSGWMNRLLTVMPKGQGAPIRGLGVGATTPLVMRGEAEVLGWAPSSLSPVDPDLPARLMALYEQSDPLLYKVLTEGVETGKIAANMTQTNARGGSADPAMMVQMAQGAANLMVQPEGPRLAALAFDGWDTHAQETARLTKLLGGLDQAIAAFETTLGPAWQDTTILVVTEFGRTVNPNGTKGTDHGTGTVAFLAGGAVKGGRIIGDWPGLKDGQLYENRDLMPTTDLRAVIKGIAADQFGVSASSLSATVFPGSERVAPIKGLIA
ncbi:DUF1501 domain-containing protein [Asticcacaulis endophyticus]|uniref:DUF1501 domain-containing protein n=1 Tax=Asticcacaulis endophyticus TaxID=1395890 RepID=A0A918Q9G0_9CAUL|nr:DUF1501 domain-containing protein [Asticcacaulis endophyticus]GGZ35943.1 hypothetical protein GCM10011273_22710 [Asticcacaulis endophyticus]